MNELMNWLPPLLKLRLELDLHMSKAVATRSPKKRLRILRGLTQRSQAGSPQATVASQAVTSTAKLIAN